MSNIVVDPDTYNRIKDDGIPYDRSKDPHVKRAAKLYNIPEDQVSSDQRKDGKKANFMDIYRVPQDAYKGSNEVNGKRLFYSNRGHLLVYKADVEDKEKYAQYPPILTCEDYIKWYELYLVFPDETVFMVHPHEFEDKLFEKGFSDTICGDHVFNPEAVALIADIQGWDIDENSYEMIIGRWEREHCNKY